jgi:hypothetical protein
MSRPHRSLLVDPLEPRRLMSTPTATRPSVNTGTGFFVNNGAVYDANGREFVMRGLNMTHAWGSTSQNLATIPELKETGANAFRAVFGTFGGGPGDAPAHRRQTVEAYVASQLTVIVEDHDGTCVDSPAALTAIVDQWVDPLNVSWLQQYEQQVILNIANEWGPNSTVWRDAYITAVQRLRTAGIGNAIMIDAGGCGQEIATIDNYAQAVWNADPQRNLIFSVHLYGLWHTGTPSGYATYNAATKLLDTRNRLRAFGAPLVVGEYSWDGFENTAYDVETLMGVMQSLDLGWLGWAWNQNSPTTLNMATNWRYDSTNDLTAWGRLMVEDPVVGFKATALPASIWPTTPDARISGTSSVAPTIDAQIDPMWQGYASRSLAQTIVGTPTTSADLGAGFRAAWDANRLYVLVEVTDDQLRNDSANPWEDDSVELMLDGDFSRNGRYDGANDYQLIFGVGDSTFSVGTGGVTTPAIVGVQFATRAVTGGWVLEASVPWTAIGTSPILNGRLGLDVAVNDDDDGGTRDHKRSFHAAADEAYRVPELFGFAQFNRDDVAPRPLASGFDVSTGHVATFEVLEDVRTSLVASDFVLTSLATNQVSNVPRSLSTTFSGDRTAARISFEPRLPDGRYRLTLPAANATDLAGNALSASASVDFYVMTSDFNRDQSVNFDDLLILAGNYNQSVETFGEGDANYDGVVNFTDLLALASKYNTSLPASLAAPLSIPGPDGAHDDNPEEDLQGIL